jgi:hypothetical protein
MLNRMCRVDRYVRSIGGYFYIGHNAAQDSACNITLPQVLVIGFRIQSRVWSAECFGYWNGYAL